MVGICRLCAALRKMDVLTTITDTNHVVCRKLRECCQIDIRLDDTLPKCICCDCIQALQQAHSFYIKVHESQESLATLFPPIVRLANVDAAKPLTLGESLASVIHFTANNDKETETSTDAECVTGDKELKTEVHITEEEQNSKEYETSIILDEDEVNLMLEKVEEEIDDEVYLIEKILGRKCGAENNEEISCDVTLTATSNSLDAHELKHCSLMDIDSDSNELPAGPKLSAAKHDVDIETDHINSSEIEEVIEEEVEEEAEEEQQEILEEEQVEDTVLEEEQRKEELKEQAPIQLQLSTQAVDEIQLDTWNAYPWLCYLCSAEESSFMDIVMHFTVAHDLHSWDEMQFKCVDCQKVCSRYYNFLNHVRFRHRAPLTLCCDVCNTICTDFKHLATHRQEQHAKNKDYPPILLCSDCGHGFKNRNSRQIHSKIHARSEPKFKCTECGKCFARQVAFKVHQKVHSDIKEFSCEQCGKSFRQKINLVTHILTHVGDKPYECSTCLKTFKTSANLEKHIKSHSSVKEFKCDYCENMFRTKDAKLSHERTHTGERPYKCEYCERSYRFRSTFLAHKNTHTGLRPYSCEPCNHYFTNWSNFNKHMKRRHDANKPAATDESTKRRRPAKDKASNSNAYFTYEVLDEFVDSPDPVPHDDANYAVSTESSIANTSRIIEISTISASSSEN